MFLVFLYLFQVLFLAILYAFAQNLSRQKQIWGMLSQFSLEIELEIKFALFLWSIFLLSDKLCVLKAIYSFVDIFVKSRDEAGRKVKSKAVPQCIYNCVVMHAH
jgi:hypothetical protein